MLLSRLLCFICIFVLVFSVSEAGKLATQAFAKKLFDAKHSFPDPEYAQEQLTLNVHVDATDVEAATVAKDAYNLGVDTLDLKGFSIMKVWRVQTQYVKAAVSETENKIIIGFRGTVSGDISDKKINTAVTLVPCTYTPTCGSIHEGFKTEYDLVRLELLKFLLDYVEGGYEIVITGHSQGGALATLCALDVRQTFGATLDRYNHFSVVTLGSPRVGDKHFVAKYNTLVPNTHRYVRLSTAHLADAATRFPPKRLGYLHVSRAINIPCAHKSLIKCHIVPGYLNTLKSLQLAEAGSTTATSVLSVAEETQPTTSSTTTTTTTTTPTTTTEATNNSNSNSNSNSNNASSTDVDLSSVAGLAALDAELNTMTTQLTDAHYDFA